MRSEPHHQYTHFVFGRADLGRSKQASCYTKTYRDSALNRLLSEQTRALRRLCPPIKAFGIGGSLGADCGDRVADIDFFLLLPNGNFFNHLRFLAEALPGLTIITRLPEPEFHPGFGFQLSYILRDGTSIEYFVNSPETLTTDPMRVKTKVLFDPEGLMTRLLRRCAVADGQQARRLLKLLAHEYLGEMVKLRKFAIRNEIVPLFPRLSRLRRVLISLDRLAIRDEVCSPHDADRRLPSDLGTDYQRGLCETFPRLTRSSVLRSVRILRRRILSRLHQSRIKGFSASGRAFFDLERNIFHDLESTLRHRAKTHLS